MPAIQIRVDGVDFWQDNRPGNRGEWFDRNGQVVHFENGARPNWNPPRIPAPWEQEEVQPAPIPLQPGVIHWARADAPAFRDPFADGLREVVANRGNVLRAPVAAPEVPAVGFIHEGAVWDGRRWMMGNLEVVRDFARNVWVEKDAPIEPNLAPEEVMYTDELEFDVDKITLLDKLEALKAGSPNPPETLLEAIDYLHKMEKWKAKKRDLWKEGYELGYADGKEGDDFDDGFNEEELDLPA